MLSGFENNMAKSSLGLKTPAFVLLRSASSSILPIFVGTLFWKTSMACGAFLVPAIESMTLTSPFPNWMRFKFVYHLALTSNHLMCGLHRLFYYHIVYTVLKDILRLGLWVNPSVYLFFWKNQRHSIMDTAQFFCWLFGQHRKDGEPIFQTVQTGKPCHRGA